MKLFQLNGYVLTVSEEAWGLNPFKSILERDTSEHKELALKEALFVYYFCDIRSNYIDMPERIRISEIKADIGLADDWEKDEIIDAACELYTRVSISVIEKLYLQSLKSAQAIGDYLENSAELLQERDKMGKPVNDIGKITTAVQRVPKLMRDLKDAYKEVVKEKEDNENKKKGARSFNLFEDGNI